jgi:hypothetical protein
MAIIGVSGGSRFRTWRLWGALVGCAGCSKDPGGEPVSTGIPTPPASVQILPNLTAGSFRVGDTIQLSVVTNLGPTRGVTWAVVTDTAVADVTSAGQLIGRKPGDGVVRADVLADRQSAAGAAPFRVLAR